MCLLTYYPEGSQVDTSAISVGASCNDDGHGFAIVVPPNPSNLIFDSKSKTSKFNDAWLLVDHDLDSYRLIEKFERMRQIFPDGPAIFHSRFATSGLRDVSNCHPFYVRGDGNQTVLAHNGILFTPKTTSRSDTKILAEDIFPFYQNRSAQKDKKTGKLEEVNWNLDDKAGFQRFEKHLTKSNKIAVLTVHPRYKRYAYLLNEEEGIWEGDIWYSNYGYAPYLKRYDVGGYVSSGYYSSNSNASTNYSIGRHNNNAIMNDDDDPNTTWGTCNICFAANSVNPVMFICTVCFSCNECSQAQDDCDCYIPESARRLAANNDSTSNTLGYPRSDTAGVAFLPPKSETKTTAAIEAGTGSTAETNIEAGKNTETAETKTEAPAEGSEAESEPTEALTKGDKNMQSTLTRVLASLPNVHSNNNHNPL